MGANNKKSVKLTLKQVCDDFNVEDIYALGDLYLEHDQKAIKYGTFDEHNSTLLINKIIRALLKVDLSLLEIHEKQVAQDTLWLWHHHAATVSIWKDHDIPRARELCDKALQYLYPTHPNKITPMIGMLLSHDVEAARKWNDAEVNDIEKEYALHLLSEYEKGAFNENSSSQ